MSNNNEHSSNRLIWLAILVTSVIIATISALFIFLQFTGKDYSKIGLKPVSSQVETPVGLGDNNDTSKENLPENPVDFKKLSEINTDIYAWIQIPNTEINHAIVQAGPDHDDFFYLNHKIEGNYE